MKGYGHGEPAPICIHYQRFAFPRVPWRKHLLASHNPPPLPLSLAVSFIPPSLQLLSPSTPKNHPASRCSPSNSQQRGRNSRTEGADQEAKPSPCMGRGRGRPGAGTPSSRGNTAPCLAQVFDTITSYLPRVDIQLFLRLRLKTNCWSGGFVKEMSVLSAEGLKLI